MVGWDWFGNYQKTKSLDLLPTEYSTPDKLRAQFSTPDKTAIQSVEAYVCKLLFIQMFQEGEDDKWSNCGRSQLLPLHQPPMSAKWCVCARLIDIAHGNLAQEHQNKKINGMFDANGNHKIVSKVVFAHVSKHMGRQDGECDICGTIDGRSDDFKSLKRRSVPCYGRDGACTHPSPPHSLFREIPKYDFSPKMCVQFKFLWLENEVVKESFKILQSFCVNGYHSLRDKLRITLSRHSSVHRSGLRSNVWW